MCRLGHDPVMGLWGTGGLGGQIFSKIKQILCELLT